MSAGGLACSPAAAGYTPGGSGSHTKITATLFDLIHRDIKGTFSFTGYHGGSATTAVTGGSFDVSF
jgi:hypothetical protein